MLVESPEGLFCPAGGFHVDPWQPVARAVVTHAHGDHARPGSAAYLCASPGAGLLRRRFGPDAANRAPAVPEPRTIGDVRVSFPPGRTHPRFRAGAAGVDHRRGRRLGGRR